ncbi:MAG: YceI family protein [Anaerolineales bacterium]|nr:YceI family protein [Anaerolineales bacterium]MCS7248350.1 YceI family protein [Anaerolineales bacterium]MDW8162163.1 YceI family protein [Anaerolineales bacterium]MDW8446718.1 YceI family protein [Anaerolineales bacterium]
MAWKIDPAHSEINFTVRHMMISNVRGRFERFEGTVEFDEQNPTRSSVEVKIEAASINTREPQRDAHLRSPDFLDVEKFPYITFKSKRIEVLDSNRGRIVGDLTIRDVTKEVTLEVEYNGTVKSPFGHTSAGFSATTTINRKDWGLQWNVPLEAGGWLVGETVHINIEIEMIKEEQTQAVA